MKEVDAATMSTPSSLRFKVGGLDCQNEVRALRAAVGPIIGGEDKLAFDTNAGLMEVMIGNTALADTIIRAVDTTGMRAHLLPEPTRPSGSALLFQVEGLDCKNEVAALQRAIGPVVGGEDRLAFDTAKGMMTVAPQRQATVDDIIRRVARPECV
ncbi:hypothetical protein AU467_22555 [Mesorhizobium loti]|uniref:HMA domain-containing protein n=1 Tax=Rhizobium loti TaxID=381 RepID=A0A101KSQ7_RHILI|nr:hypothetical protein AU467_22555 [Mesorhizobium loti]